MRSVVWLVVSSLLLSLGNSGSAVHAEKLTTDVIIIGAGTSGIMAGKTLSEKGITDFIILEATDRIGGRMRTQEFAGLQIELGANWVEGVGSDVEINPIWKLANEVNLRTFYSQLNNQTHNLYDVSGALPPQDKAGNILTDSNACTTSVSNYLKGTNQDDISVLTAERLYGKVPSSPVDMALEYELYDGEFAEPPRVTSLKNTQPLPTFNNFGPDLYFVADQRGFVAILEPLTNYLESENGNFTDSRLKFYKIVNKIQYSAKGVTVFTEDGSVYTAKAAILTVSLGVLQSDLINFQPDLPFWKLKSIFMYDMAIYTKIFLKFPYRFWRTGNGTEYFLYADDTRGYYPIWQHLDNEYPDAHIIFVTVTDDESRRIEQQSDIQTMKEVMDVLRSMYGPNIPNPEAILVPRWWTNRFFGGSFSNWPVGISLNEFQQLQAPSGRLYFSGEHTNTDYNGYIHGAYYAGIDAAHAVLDCLQKKQCPPLRNTNNSTKHFPEPTCVRPD